MPKSCGNDALAAKIVCPYFSRLVDHMIVCENDDCAGEYGRIFRRREDMRAFASGVCCSAEYASRCSHAAILKKKYDE